MHHCRLVVIESSSPKAQGLWGNFSFHPLQNSPRTMVPDKLQLFKGPFEIEPLPEMTPKLFTFFFQFGMSGSKSLRLRFHPWPWTRWDIRWELEGQLENANDPGKANFAMAQVVVTPMNFWASLLARQKRPLQLKIIFIHTLPHHH